MKSLSCRHQINNQGLPEQEGPSRLTLLELHVFRQNSEAVTLFLMHKTEFSQGHTMKWGGRSKQTMAPGSEDEPPLMHHSVCWMGRGQYVLDLASIQEAQWTLSDTPSSDLLTPSRVINQASVSSAYTWY